MQHSALKRPRQAVEWIGTAQLPAAPFLPPAGVLDIDSFIQRVVLQTIQTAQLENNGAVLLQKIEHLQQQVNACKWQIQQLEAKHSN